MKNFIQVLFGCNVLYIEKLSREASFSIVYSKFIDKFRYIKLVYTLPLIEVIKFSSNHISSFRHPSQDEIMNLTQTTKY